MLIKARYWREHRPVGDHREPREVQTTYHIDVICTAESKAEPLHIEVSSDRDLCEIHGHVNDHVRRFVERHLQMVPEALAPGTPVRDLPPEQDIRAAVSRASFR